MGANGTEGGELRDGEDDDSDAEVVKVAKRALTIEGEERLIGRGESMVAAVILFSLSLAHSN